MEQTVWFITLEIDQISHKKEEAAVHGAGMHTKVINLLAILDGLGSCDCSDGMPHIHIWGIVE